VQLRDAQREVERCRKQEKDARDTMTQLQVHQQDQKTQALLRFDLEAYD
jgi:hypothetical protein